MNDTNSEPQDASDNAPASFTGLKRERKTRFSIKFADTASKTLITVGGVGTIVAVLAVCLYLLSEVIPLFTSGAADKRASGDAATLVAEPIEEPVAIGTDQFKEMVYLVGRDGVVDFYYVDKKHGPDGTEVDPADDSVAKGFRHLNRIDLVEEYFNGVQPTSWFFSSLTPSFAVGFADGSVRVGKISFPTEFYQFGEEPHEEFKQLDARETAVAPLVLSEGAEPTIGVGERTPSLQIRFSYPKLTFQRPVMLAEGHAITAIDLLESDGDATIAAIAADGSLRVSKPHSDGRVLLTVGADGAVSHATPKKDMLGNVRYRTIDLESDAMVSDVPPARVFLDPLTQEARVLWPGGELRRIAIFRNAYRTPQGRVQTLWDYGDLLEELDLLEGDLQIVERATVQMLGRRTLLVSDTAGGVMGWIDARSDAADFTNHAGEIVTSPDRRTLLPEHDLSDASAATVLATGTRSRLMAAGDESGLIRVFNATSEKQVVSVRLDDVAIKLLAISPKEDGFVGLGENGELVSWVKPEGAHWYHEVSIKAMLAPMHYEGYDSRGFHWQSTGGSDDYEAKISLMPLIFGTLKATLYSMIFGAPLALLAAIYSSEFMGNKTRSVVKPTIELMASLPSVVLGFLAGTIIASTVEDSVVAVLLSFVVVPFVFVLGAHLWQMAPPRVFLLFRWLRLPLVAFALLIGILLSIALAGPVEKALFSVEVLEVVGEAADPATGTTKPVYGDVLYTEHSIALWLSTINHTDASPSGFRSSATPGWLMLFLPLSIFAVAFINMRVVNPWLKSIGGHLGQQRFAALALARFAVSTVAVLVVAYLLSTIVGQVVDARGSYIGKYDQRNALVVGFVMGFAIIPIIYTIADDALTSVPKHLRSASLGCGATPWQTAVRIVIPTAMSGLFSAVMIGLGRAVGETMIVLMAAGNTPVMEMNIFEGFRTLSANIAVELPEAPKGEWHYKLLFLSALVLFAFTFILNTAAEAVRLRFRKRAVNL